MNTEFIPYEHAVVLKELGFEEHYHFATHGNRNGNPMICSRNGLCGSGYEIMCKAILYQQAFRFFREKYKIDIHTWEITECFKRYYLAEIINDLRSTNLLHEDKSMIRFNSKEEAELACLKKIIEIVKQK